MIRHVSAALRMDPVQHEDGSVRHKNGIKFSIYLFGFFHRFCGFKNNRISETLSLGEKFVSLAKNPFILMEEI